MMKARYIALTAILAGLTATAQDLHKEITVDRTVQPELHEATRLKGITPSILTPEVKPKQLHPSEYTEAGTLTNEIGMLPPAPWADSIPRTPYRGYAAVGYLPVYNLMANAGYRIVDTGSMGLGIWAQYDGESYNGDLPYYDDALLTNHALAVGLDGAMRFGRASMLTAGIEADYSSVRMPYYYTLAGNKHWRSYKQGATDISAHAKWASQSGTLAYDVRGRLEYFGFGNSIPAELVGKASPAKQGSGTLGASFGQTDEGGTIPWIGLDLDWSLAHTKGLKTPDNLRYKVYTLNLVKFAPFLRFDNDKLEGRVGFDLTYTSGYDKGRLRIAPNAAIDIHPMRYLDIFAQLRGGQHINYLSDVFAINPYIMPYEAFGTTNMPVIAEGGVAFVPVDGLRLAVHGGAAMARGILSPLITINSSGYMQSTMYAANANSWYAGASASYSYRTLARAEIDFRMGGSNKDTHSWYEWADAAKYVTKGALTVTPVAPLDITLGCEIRYQRKATSLIYSYDSASTERFHGVPSLGTVQNLNLAGTYRISPALTAFLQVENLLCKRYKLISGMPGPGINGLLGISWKF